MFKIYHSILKSKKVFFWILIFLLQKNNILYSQKENNTWIIGHQYTNKKENSIDTGILKLFGGNIFNFNIKPFDLNRVANNLSLNRLVINHCDRFGNLLFYSNGSKIFNYEHKLIENSDSLNFSLDAINPKDSGVYALRSISGWSQSMIVIRNPILYNQYYIFSLYLNWGILAPDLKAFTKLQYSILDMSLNDGKGKLIVKEKLIDSGNYGNGLFACKKANGKDWWIFARDMNKSNCFHKMSLDGNGVRLESEKECIGYIMWSKDNDTLPNAHFGNFSPDGKHFAFASNYGLEVFDFDRCTGKFSNRRAIDYPIIDSFKNLGFYSPTAVVFSPNSRFLYYSNSFRILQFDMNTIDFKSSFTTIAYYDGFKDHYNEDTSLVGIPTYFNQSVIAPDGRIYVGHPSTRYMSYIDSPNNKGLSCNFKAHAIKTQSYCGNPPYHPHYELGAMDCCLGGINTNLARTDTTLNSRDTGGKYQWLYCDSNFKPIPNAQSDIFKPLYTGVYALKINKGVCVDTTDCVDFEYKRPGSGILSMNNHEFSIFPNPANDYVKIDDKSNSNFRVYIYDIIGRIRLTDFRNKQIDIKSLENGVYPLKIVDKDGSELFRDKLIIQR